MENEVYLALGILITTSIIVMAFFFKICRQDHDLKAAIAKLEMHLNFNHDLLIAYVDNKLQKDLENLELKIYQVLPAAFPLIRGKK